MDGARRLRLDKKAAQRRVRYAATKPLQPGVMRCGSAPGFFWMPTVQIIKAPTQRALPTPTRAPCTVVASAKHVDAAARKHSTDAPNEAREEVQLHEGGDDWDEVYDDVDALTTPVTTLATAAPDVTQTTLLLQFPADEQGLVIELCGVRARACLSLTCHALHALPLLRRLIKQAAEERQRRVLDALETRQENPVGTLTWGYPLARGPARVPRHRDDFSLFIVVSCPTNARDDFCLGWLPDDEGQPLIQASIGQKRFRDTCSRALRVDQHTLSLPTHLHDMEYDVFLLRKGLSAETDMKRDSPSRRGVVYSA